MSLQIVQNQQLVPIGDKVPIDTQLSTTSENAISNKAVTEEFKKSGTIVLHRHTDDLLNNTIVGEWKLYPERNTCYVSLHIGSYNNNFEVDDDYLEFVGLNVTFTNFIGISHIYAGTTDLQRGMNGQLINSQTSGTSSALKLNFTITSSWASMQYMALDFNGALFYQS